MFSNLYKFRSLSKCDKLSNIIRVFYSTELSVKPNEIVKPIISCRRKEFDFYSNKKYDKLQDVTLASKGWHHKKSKGDYFILHSTSKESPFENDSFTVINGNLKQALENENVFHPTAIQSKCIPIILSGKNTMIAAETGCGKTLAYLIPIIDLIIEHKRNSENTQFNSPLCLILTPSRELAFQVHRVAQDLLKHLNMNSEIVVGGSIKRKMMNPKFSMTDILVATPGAMSKLFTTNVYKADKVKYVVLDEADTLLDESFSEKICSILRRFLFTFENNHNDIGVQLILASATLPVHLPDAINNIINPESLVKVTTENLHKILGHVPQRFLRTGSSTKPLQLLEIVRNCVNKNHAVMIFSNTSETCDWISLFLKENGIKCINLNGEMNLNIRKDMFINFQKGNVNVISCTDVGSRGLDTTRVKKFSFRKKISF